MTDYTALDILVVFAGVGGAFLALRPYVPAWAWYSFYVGVALYGVLRVVEHGISTKGAVFVALFVLAAAHTWWHDLRGRRVENMPRGDQGTGKRQ